MAWYEVFPLTLGYLLCLFCYVVALGVSAVVDLIVNPCIVWWEIKHQVVNRRSLCERSMLRSWWQAVTGAVRLEPA